MVDKCRQCVNESLMLSPTVALPGSYALAGRVERGHVSACICTRCGPTVVDHSGWCLGACDEGHGDLPVPFTEKPVLFLTCP